MELDQTDEQKARLEDLIKLKENRLQGGDSDDTSDSSSSDSGIGSHASKQREAREEPPTITAPPEGKWYYVSDSHVMEVSEEKVLNAQAYLLFYERIY